MCTHGKTHLADGLVIGDLIECPKHNGRFNFKDGSVKRAPVCVGLNTYKTKVVDGVIMIDPNCGTQKKETKKSETYEVISNSNLSTFIKELKIKPVENKNIEFTPGDYMQLEIPKYQLNFNEIEIKDNLKKVWRNKGLFGLNSKNRSKITRNYSIATNPKVEDYLKFNVRLALPLNGTDNPPGLGSSYLFNLKKGDTIELFGPFGDFHLKQTQKEIIFIGGGAGMAPFRSQISYLFDTMKTKRKVSYWYGARSKQEIFYEDYFILLDKKNENFNFNLALSEPLPEDNWKGYVGYIHEVVNENYLNTIARISKIEFYLCGPPQMIKACREMLIDIGVKNNQILFDAF
jgi:Na(+)-translocating NADH:ubiquinone oxidoreductase F subunit